MPDPKGPRWIRPCDLLRQHGFDCFYAFFNFFSKYFLEESFSLISLWRFFNNLWRFRLFWITLLFFFCSFWNSGFKHIFLNFNITIWDNVFLELLIELLIFPLEIIDINTNYWIGRCSLWGRNFSSFIHRNGLMNKCKIVVLRSALGINIRSIPSTRSIRLKFYEKIFECSFSQFLHCLFFMRVNQRLFSCCW